MADLRWALLGMAAHSEQGVGLPRVSFILHGPAGQTEHVLLIEMRGERESELHGARPRQGL